jgi:hypothetical protein
VLDVEVEMNDIK